jgi:hypothetical protein
VVVVLEEVEMRPEGSQSGPTTVVRSAAVGKISDGARGRALAGGRSEQGAGCSRDFGPLEEALVGGGKVEGKTEWSSGEDRRKVEGKTE